MGNGAGGTLARTRTATAAITVLVLVLAGAVAGARPAAAASPGVVYFGASFEGDPGAAVRALDLSTNEMTTITEFHRGIGHPSISADGQWIAYSPQDDINQPMGLWLIRTDGTGKRQLTTGDDDQPSWSPDGSRIAFSRYDGQTGTDLFVVDVTSGQVTQLTFTEHPTNEVQADWSPDGSRIAYYEQGGGYADDFVVLVDPDGSGRTVPYDGFATTPDWSPDGSSILVEAGQSWFYTMDPETGELTSLFNGDDVGGIRIEQPAWNHDASRVVFVAEHSVGDHYEFYVHSARPDGSDLKTHTPRLTSYTYIESAFDGGSAPPPEPEPDPRPAPQARATDDSCPEGEVPSQDFDDVDPGGTHSHSIDCIGWWDITKGATANTYDPTGKVTRAQMASFIARLILQAGSELPDDPPDAFTDDDGNKHEHAINQLAAVDVVGGKTATTYDPAGKVNRAQMASFIARAYEYLTGEQLPAGEDWFADDDQSNHEDNINRVAEAGITGGSGGGYDPGGDVTRAQMASFIARLLDLLVEEGHASTPQ